MRLRNRLTWRCGGDVGMHLTGVRGHGMAFLCGYQNLFCVEQSRVGC